MKNSRFEPLLSVCMITYGHAKFIEQSINSILSQQTDFEFELAIANDCSPDNTDEIVNRIATEHSFGYRIRYISHSKNIGVMPNFTSLMAGCTTKYLALCEGDDYWMDDTKLQKQVDYLEKNEHVVLTCHDALDVDTGGVFTASKRLKETELRDFSARELQEGAYVLTLTMCFRNVIRAFPPEFNHVFNGDLFLTILLGAYGDCHFHRDIKPAAYRVHAGGMWSLKPQDERWKMAATSYLHFAKYFKRMHQTDLMRHYIQWYTARGEEVFAYYIREGRKQEALNYTHTQSTEVKAIDMKAWMKLKKRNLRLWISRNIERSAYWEKRENRS